MRIYSVEKKKRNIVYTSINVKSHLKKACMVLKQHVDKCRESSETIFVIYTVPNASELFSSFYWVRIMSVSSLLKLKTKCISKEFYRNVQ